MSIKMRQLFFPIKCDSGRTVILDAYIIEKPYTTTLPSGDWHDFREWGLNEVGFDVFSTFFGALGPVEIRLPENPTSSVRDRYNKLKALIPKLQDVSPNVVSNASKLFGETFTLGNHKYKVHQQPDSSTGLSYDNRLSVWDETSSTWQPVTEYTCYVQYGIHGYPLKEVALSPLMLCTDINDPYNTWEFKNKPDAIFRRFGIQTRLVSTEDLEWNGIVECKITDGGITGTDPYTVIHNFYEDLFSLSTPKELTGSAYALVDSSASGGGYDNADYNDSTDDINTDLFNSSTGTSALAATSTIYVPDTTQFTNFFDVLYGTDVSSRIANVVSSIATLGGKVTDYIVDVFILPFHVDATGSYKFNMGFYDVLPNGQGGMWTAPIATKRFAEIDMGTIEITERWGNALDYETDIQLYLPYIGYIKLDGRTVMGKTIGLIYNVDIMTGNCIAQVHVIWTDELGEHNCVLYQATGNCAYKLPSSQDNRANQMISMVGDAVKLAGVLSGV